MSTNTLDSSLRLRPTFGSPNILLLHPDAERRRSWASVLPLYRSVQEADDWGKAEELLRTTDVHVLVCPWPWSREHLPELAQREGLRILYVGSQLPDEVVEDAAAGHRVAFAANERALPLKLIDLVWPLRLEQARHAVDDLQVVWPGKLPRIHRVVDLSPGGFSFEIDAQEPLEELVPGSILSGLSFTRGGQECIRGAQVEIRNLAALPGGYRVGCAFRVTEAHAESSSQPLHDPVRCVGLLKSALRKNGMTVVTASGDQRRAASGSVDAQRQELTLNVALPSAGVGDVLHGFFEVNGASYHFDASVLEAKESITLRMPALLEERYRRKTERRRLEPPLPVRLTSPLFDQPEQAELVDLSTTGCALRFEGTARLAPGAWIDSLAVRCDGRSLSLQGEVTHCTVADERGGMRCGLRFEGITDEQRLAIAHFVMRSAVPALSSGEDISFRELLDLFDKTQLFKREYMEQLAPTMPRIEETFRRLHHAPGTLFRPLVVQHQGSLAGHLSLIRAYSRTWFIQHLASLPGPHRAPYLLNVGGAELIMQLSDLDFFKIAFFADNKWPARIFGRFARRIEDGRLSVLRAYLPGTLHMDLSRHTLTESPEVRVREAKESELHLVERYFVRTRPDVLLRSDDLTKNALLLSTLGARYSDAGLLRRRHVLLAQHQRQTVAFALVERASPGLNLQEHFNSIRVHLLEPLETPERLAVRSALLRHAAALFSETGLTFGRVFFRSSEATDHETLGITPGRRVVEWTCHRSQLPRFTDHVDRVFAALFARAQGRAQRRGEGSE